MYSFESGILIGLVVPLSFDLMYLIISRYECRKAGHECSRCKNFFCDGKRAWWIRTHK